METLKSDQYLQVVRAALSVRQYRFAREAALYWLATYPGDLGMGLYYAQALLGEKRPSQAMRVLQGLCMADPEAVEAAETLLRAESAIFDAPVARTSDEHPLSAGSMPADSPGRSLSADRPTAACVYALTGKTPGHRVLAAWGIDLRQARQSLEQGDLTQAEAMIRNVLSLDPPTDVLYPPPLAGVTHLQILNANRIVPLQAKLDLAERYHQRWPDCLVCTLFLADWLMESSDAGRAVRLLHMAAARDVSGQVAHRLWGAKHPYTPLWPEQLELSLKVLVPADVAACLGWNRLPAGPEPAPVAKQAVPDATPHGVIAPAERLSPPDVLYPPIPPLEQPYDPGSADDSKENPAEEMQAEPPALPTDVLYPPQTPDACAEEQGVLSPPDACPEERGVLYPLEAQPATLERSTEQDAPQGEAGLPLAAESTRANQEVDNVRAETLHQVQDELDRIANRLHLPGLARLDGRFPIYVVFSVRSRLEAIYGPQLAAYLESEMRRLVQVIQNKRGWGARLFFPDDPASLAELGLKPARPGDAWELKLALADLDALLARRGEMIGALLIVGGPEIVPFHHLPNPVDDQDLDVPSDNPYSTRDENYFVPEWPVGRLPGGAGKDARLLLGALRRISAHHAALRQQPPWYRHWLETLAAWLRPGRQRKRPSFGYTAAIWRRAASSVFRPIGEPDTLHVSPPLGIYGHNGADQGGNGSTPGKNGNGVPVPVGRLGYFNLHGLVDAPDWYGQRDPLDALEGPDYPIALRPQDIGRNGRPNALRSPNSGVPQVIFSEACYGLHILGKTSGGAICLKFLEAGSLAVVGSTCMAYGSIGTPLIAADLLGQAFWRNLKNGLPTGEALRQAKIQLAHVMHQRQGYLDGEDQKTLIAFILYGDPLAQPLDATLWRKSVRRLAGPMTEIRTVCDRCGEPNSPQVVPEEVMISVKQVVSQYLPGMSGARVAYSQERRRCSGKGHECPTHQLGGECGQRTSDCNGATERPSGKSYAEPASADDMPDARRLVTLSKQIACSQEVHPIYARLTLDGQGKVVKLVVSR